MTEAAEKHIAKSSFEVLRLYKALDKKIKHFPLFAQSG